MSSAAKLNSVEATYQTYSTTVVFQTSSEVEFKTFRLSNPDRIVVDLMRVYGDAALPDVSASTTIKNIRNSKSKKKYRYVFDLKQPTQYSYAKLKNPNRIVIRFKDDPTKKYWTHRVLSIKVVC